MGELQVTTRAYAPTVTPRCLSRDAAAAYLSVSVDQLDRLVHTGRLATVRLPVERSRHTGKGTTGVNRRILIDVKDLDRLVDQSKERA